jgi:ADP-ribosyl-[dinitrogen reductase] hydrolase
MMELLERFRGCLLGLAAGDAVGTTVEFSPRGSFTPLTDMVGGGPFRLKAGEWTDDTSMALCLATSLVERGGFDARDQMERYVRWHENGYLSSNGRCFDIGNTTRRALHLFKCTGSPFSGSTDPQSAGNGSLMRLAPVALIYYPDRELTWFYTAESSRTTHASQECLDACRYFGDLLCLALAGKDKAEILAPRQGDGCMAAAVRPIVQGSYRDKSREQIRGSGYVVASLEAALWCFWRTESFEQAILEAANLGDDADTTAAICGQLAGAYYGESGIPAHWLERLAMGEEIGGLAERLMRG